jgi:glycogen operon protein
MAQDPVLAQAKLIAEPWDIGLGGYQVGAFPTGWSEWNDVFRRAARRFWRGEGSLIGDMAHAMTGSALQFQHDGRGPRAGINHVTVHDGFTLADLVGYETKHNEANGEDNRDGSDDNLSTNCGVEGPSEEDEIVALRRKLRKNLLATLFFAQGVPLLLAGDEIANTQGGNNNAYCQDNEVGWVEWSQAGTPDDLTGFIGHLIQLRRRFPQLKPHRWLEGRRADGSYDVKWLTPAAAEMDENDWNFPDGRFLSYVLAAAREFGEPLFVVLNGADHEVEITLPEWPNVTLWESVLDTSDTAHKAERLAVSAQWTAPARCVLAFAGIP